MCTVRRAAGAVLARSVGMYRSVTVAALCALSAVAACKKEQPTPTESEQPAASATGAGGPTVSDIKVPDVQYSTNQADIDKGKELFTAKGCNACHKIGGGKLVGPDLKGVTARRDKQWIAKMISRPDIMIKEDPTAKDLFKTHLTPMPNQGVSEADLAPIMSYLKANE